MKYHIDTIPMWDALNKDSECPLCLLHNKLEDKYVEFYLGDSVMQPDNRQKTNQVGFCCRHYNMMYQKKLKLPLGLSTQTRLDYINDELDKYFDNVINSNKSYKKSGLDKLTGNIDDILGGCCICNDIDKNMKRYYYTFIHMWHKEDEFRERFGESKGLCLHHFNKILEFSDNPFSQDKSLQLAKALCQVQKNNLQRLAKEVKYFNDKFDHRNADKPWGTSKDSLPRAINKLSGHTLNSNN